MKRIVFLLLTAIIIISSSVVLFAHSGGTDGNGGHDSPDGYHYHHGYPAHDHEDLDGDGKKDCPYNFYDNVDHQYGSSSSNNDIKLWSISNKKSVPVFWIFLILFGIAGITTVITRLVCKGKDDKSDYYAYPLICFMGLVSPISFLASYSYYLPGILNILCGILFFIGLLPAAPLCILLLQFLFNLPIWIYRGCKNVVMWFRDNASDVKGCLMVWIPLLIMLTLCLLVVICSDNSESKSTPKPPSYDYKAFETWEPLDIPPPPEYPFDTYY